MLRRLPIAAQVIALVALAALLPAAAMVTIAFSRPPPRQAPARVEHVAQELAGHVRPPAGTVISRHDSVPEPPRGMIRSRPVEQALARASGTVPDNVRAFREAGPPPPRYGNLFGRYFVALRQGDGRWVALTTPRDAALDRWRWVTGTAVGAAMLVVLLLGLLLARRIVTPIRRLGRAAEQVRTGEPWTMPLPEGPPEVRQAVLSLIDLDERTRGYNAQRLTMLAAIAHDIGTPIARLAFRVEGLGLAARDAAMGDIETIRRLLADSLTLAREWNGQEEAVDFAALLSDLAGREAPLGREIDWRILAHPQLTGHRLSLQRMVQNLIDNALRYGTAARVVLAQEQGAAVLTVTDDGPGFPPGTATQDLLKPYVRGDASRNPASGGSGLGLAIVHQVVRRHGGTIELGQAPEGGAQVTVRLPLG